MTNFDIVLVMPHPQPGARLLYRLSGVLHPLGLGYIASYLKKEGGYKVSLVDNTIQGLSEEQFKGCLRQQNPRYLGLSLYTGCLSTAFSFARAAKEVNDDIIVIAGGPHASALPGEVLRNKDIDIIVKGEGEETMLELVRTIDKKGNLKDVKGIAYKENGRIIENQNRELIGDLDSLPMPAYELLPMRRYYLAPSRRFTYGNIGSIITSRGCPYRCTFCSRVIFGQSIRYRSPEAVLDEIKYLVSNFGVREIEIRDDAFTCNEERAIEICRLIEKNKLNIIWNCCGRVNHISDRLFSALYQAGCRAIFIGAESGSQRILDLLKKDITLAQVELAIKQCKKHRLLSLTSFIIGTPYETEESIKETIEFAKRLNPDYVSFCAFTPLPGSGLFNDIVAQGLIDIKNIDWDSYLRLLLFSPPAKIGYFSGEELVKWQRSAIRQFYFRPSYIINRIKKIKSHRDLYQMFLGMYVIIGHQLRKINFKKVRSRE